MKKDKIEHLLRENNGIIKLSKIVNNGISKQYFMQYAKEKGLERIAHGIYMSEDAMLDDMYVLQLRYPTAVFSHETALYLHLLNDREPLNFTITVKAGYNITNLKKQNVKVYFLPEQKYNIGLTTAETIFGNIVNTYNVERTLCDIFRSRKEIEIQDIIDSIKSYARKKNKNITLLMKYAEIFKVQEPIRTYLEVLL